jgi:hypothetical protein
VPNENRPSLNPASPSALLALLDALEGRDELHKTLAVELWTLNDEIRAYLHSRKRFHDGDIYLGRVQQRLAHLLGSLTDVHL